MIGMNDDTRFLTENRHGQLLAEAEIRRLAGGGAVRDGSNAGGALHGLGRRLFGQRRDAAAAVTVEATAPDTTPAPRLTVAPASGSGASSRDCVEGRVAA